MQLRSSGQEKVPKSNTHSHSFFRKEPSDEAVSVDGNILYINEQKRGKLVDH